jgi:hypothetical protein
MMNPNEASRLSRGHDGMGGNFRFIAMFLVATLLLMACATAPQAVVGDSLGYIEKNMTSPMVKGGEFYMATGQVNIYNDTFLVNPKPTGRKVDIAVAIQADAATGKVLRIVAIQPVTPGAVPNPVVYNDGTSIFGNSPYTIGDLRGGIVVNDIQPFPHWVNAIDAMRKAMITLGTFDTYANVNGQALAPLDRS